MLVICALPGKTKKKIVKKKASELTEQVEVPTSLGSLFECPEKEGLKRKS